MLINGKEWRLVPVEPTLQMMDAADDRVGVWQHEESVAAYAAMIDSAPTPPAQASGQAAPSDGLRQQYLDLLQEVLDAKEVMLAAGCKQDQFSAMFREYAGRYGQAPAASAEPVLRIYAEGSMRSVTEWLDGARDFPDGDHTLYAAPVAAQAPEHLLYRLRKHADDDRNSAFARSTMREALQYMVAAQAPQNDDETEGLRAHIALLKASLAQCERELDELRVAAQAPQEPEEPLPPPGIHAAVHYAGWLRREAHRHQEPKAGVLRQAARMLDVLKAECGRLHQELIDAQAPAVPPEKPLPDLMMASYHEAVGWNACRAAMLANSPAVAPAVPEESTTAARDEFPMLYDSLDALDERAAEQPERVGTKRHLSSLRTSIQAVVQKLSLARARIADLESATLTPPASAAPAPADLDAAFEAVRKRLCKLPKYSFLLDGNGGVRRVTDTCGNWIEFDAAHALFDPVAVDAAIQAGGSHD